MSGAVAQAMRDAGCLNRRSLGLNDVFPPGSENPADTMTKQEHLPAFQRMRSRMNIR